jgi:type II secretory pathway component PulM
VKSIEEITTEYPAFSHPDLVKIDTDGSDFPILVAMKSWLRSNLPNLFFEFDPSFSPTGVTDGLEAIQSLNEIGYTYFFIFDNYGNPLCEIDTNHRKRFSELCSWLASHHRYGLSVAYIDVLASISGNVPWLRRLVDSYSIVQ